MICTSIGNIFSTKNYYGSVPTKVLVDFLSGVSSFELGLSPIYTSCLYNFHGRKQIRSYFLYLYSTFTSLPRLPSIQKSASIVNNILMKWANAQGSHFEITSRKFWVKL